MRVTLPTGYEDSLIWWPERGMGFHPRPAMDYTTSYWEEFRQRDASQMGELLTEARLALVRRHYAGQVVDTIQGFELSSNDGWVSRTTSAGVGTLSVEIASRLFRIQDDGSVASRMVDFRIQYREVGATDWTELGFIGATYATHYWSGRMLPGGTTQVRMGSTDPSEHSDGELWYETDPATGETYRGQWKWVPHPYQLGQPWEGIAPDPVISPGTPGFRMWGNRQEPTRAQINWNVTDGQYEIRVMKVTPDINESRESNETAVSQILVHQIDRGDYSGQARIALRIKATGQLNGSVDEFNAIASAVCPVWNGSSWVTQETSNPAWWFLWFARGRKGIDGRRLFGVGLDDSEIDIDGIKAWAAWCDARRLSFNYVLDRKISAAEVLDTIARAGRAAKTQQTGKLGVVWNAENLPEVATFGPFNIKAGSFQVAYTNESTVDEIVVSFVDATRNWTLNEVRVAVPGKATSGNPLQLDLDGCTDLDMAGREANLIAASQVWHRRRVTFETDIEGFVATKGDVIRLTHDLTVWGYSGRMMPGSRGGSSSGLPKIVLDSEVPSSGSGIVLLRDPAGNMKTASVVSSDGNVTELTIVTDLEGFAMPGDEPFEDTSTLDWVWQFAPLEMPGRRFKITSVEPAPDGVKFSAIDDDPGYYESESNPYVYTPPRDGVLLGGVIFSLRFNESIRSVQNDVIDVQMDWAISISSRVQIAYSINGVELQPITTEARQTTVSAKTGDVIVATIRPVNSIGTGQPFTASCTVQGLLSPLPAVTGLTSVFRDGLTTLVWNPVVDIRQPDYEVRLGTTWANSRTIGTTRNLDMLAVGNGTYFVAARFQTRGVTIYGPADTVQISGAVLVRNVLVTVQEDPTWTGTLTGGAFIHDGELTLTGVGDILSAPNVLGLEDVLWFGGSDSGGIYTTNASNLVDLGYEAPVRVDFEIDEYALNFAEDFLALPDVLSEVDILNDSNRQHYRVRPQIQFALDDGIFGEWQDYIPGTINARYFNARLVLETDQPMIVPFVRHFSWTIDVPDLVQSGTAVTVPVGGLRINFPKHFHMKPNLQVTTLDAVDGDRAVVVQDVDPEDGFNILMFNNATPVDRVVNWLAQGY